MAEWDESVLNDVTWLASGETRRSAARSFGDRDVDSEARRSTNPAGYQLIFNPSMSNFSTSTQASVCSRCIRSTIIFFSFIGLTLTPYN